MLYAILAYHVENEVNSWSAEEDAALPVGQAAPPLARHGRRFAGAAVVTP